jgi:hypothetical protein
MVVWILVSGAAQPANGHTSRRIAPIRFEAAPFALGVPTVRYGEDCTGGLHDPNAKLPPCAPLGEPHASKATTSEA